MGRTIIVGAGISGLAAAYELVKRGEEVLVVERAPTVGGLARSFHYGPFTFDVGAHAFATGDPLSVRLVREVLGENCVKFGARVGFYVCGRFLEDPHGDMTQLARLPVGVFLRGLWDFLWRPPKCSGESIADYARAFYGNTFYKHLIKPAVEKTLHVPCERVSVDLAPLMVINFPKRRIKLSDLPLKAARRLGRYVMASNGNGTGGVSYLYPAEGGFEAFVRKLAEMIRQGGGRILTGTTITELERAGETITAARIGEEKMKLDWLVWSGGLGPLLALLGMNGPRLKFSSLLLFNFEVRGEPLCDYHWVECWDPEVSAKRFSIPSLMSPNNAPAGCYGVSVEIPCAAQGEIRQNPEPALEKVKEELVHMKVVRKPGDFARAHVETIKVAYPVLEVGYRAHLEQTMEALHNSARNVVLLGYAAALPGKMQNDQMRQALQVAEQIAASKADHECHHTVSRRAPVS